MPSVTRPKTLAALVMVGCIVPVFFAFNYVFRFGVNVVFWDEWEIVPFFKDMYTGRLTVASLFSQHNEHRIFFPRLIMLGLGHLTAYDTVALMFTSWGLLVATTAALAYQHLQLYGRTLWSLALFCPIPWIVFTLRQADNLLWGWQMQIILCLTSFVIACVLLQHPERTPWRFAVAAGCAIISAYSFSTGLLAWPSLLIYLLCHHRTRSARAAKGYFLKLAGVWAGIGAVVWALYLNGYTKPAYHPSLAWALHNPIDGLQVFVATCGSLFSSSLHSEEALGAILLALVAFLAAALWRGQLVTERALPAIPLILFAGGTALLITLGRGGFGAEDVATAVRYVSITMLGFVAAYYGVLAIKDDVWRHWFQGALGVLLILAIFASYDGAIPYGIAYRKARREGSNVLRSYDTRPRTDLLVLYPRADVVLERAPVLRKYHLNVFANHP
jgi:hypothetical protein